jgi:sulfonate transport system ATP-binding protein
VSALLHAVVVEKSFGDSRVLVDAEISIAQGRIVSLVGLSGCGKSTLLRIIAGLERNFRGTLTLDGRQIRGLHPEIGFIFQEPRLLPWLTVAENVGFAAGPAGARDSRTTELLAAVGLRSFADALPKTLSGGMAQRVAIARGLFSSPQLLLLDEPFSAVDAFTRMKLQDMLLDLTHERGTTLLTVTHDLDEAIFLGDEVFVMSSRPGSIRKRIPVHLSRPRDRGSTGFAEIRRQIYRELFAGAEPRDDYAI